MAESLGSDGSVTRAIEWRIAQSPEIARRFRPAAVRGAIAAAEAATALEWPAELRELYLSADGMTDHDDSFDWLHGYRLFSLEEMLSARHLALSVRGRNAAQRLTGHTYIWADRPRSDINGDGDGVVADSPSPEELRELERAGARFYVWTPEEEARQDKLMRKNLLNAVNRVSFETADSDDDETKDAPQENSVPEPLGEAGAQIIGTFLLEMAITS